MNPATHNLPPTDSKKIILQGVVVLVVTVFLEKVRSKSLEVKLTAFVVAYTRVVAIRAHNERNANI